MLSSIGGSPAHGELLAYGVPDYEIPARLEQEQLADRDERVSARCVGG